MATTINNEIIAYNPSSLVGIFNNALTIEVTKKVFRIKGIYIQGRGVNYNGFYYDTLKDETSDACVTLIVPGVIRNELNTDQTIEGSAYLTKKTQLIGGRIELHVNLIELLSQNDNKYTEEQVKALEVQQRKASQGYKD